MQDYIPQNEASLSLWLQSLDSNIAVQGPTIGLQPTEVTEISGICKSIVKGINDVQLEKNILQNLIANKDGIKKNRPSHYPQLFGPW